MAHYGLAARSGPIYSMRRTHEFARSLIVSICLLSVLLGGGTLGWILVEDQSPMDAFYATIQVISTLGFGDRAPKTKSGELLVILLVPASFIVIAWLSIRIVTVVVAGELTDEFTLRKNLKRIGKMENHIIVCGLGRVGSSVVQHLRESQAAFVGIDSREEVLEQVLQPDDLRVLGDSTEDDILLAAGVERARGLVVCLSDDASNVFTILSAKGLNAQLFIISRALTPSSEEKLMRAGADRVVTPSMIGGRRMAHMVLQPRLVDFIDETFSISGYRKPILMEEFILEAGCRMVGSSLRESEIKSATGVMIVAVRNLRGEVDLNPPSHYRFSAGETLIGLGYADDIQRLRTYLSIDGS